MCFVFWASNNKVMYSNIAFLIFYFGANNMEESASSKQIGLGFKDDYDYGRLAHEIKWINQMNKKDLLIFWVP